MSQLIFLRYASSVAKPAQTITSKRLRERMQEVGADQETLATGVGVTQGAISQILTGRSLNSRHLPAIADKLEVSLAWLRGASDDKGAWEDRPVDQSTAATQLDAVMVPLYDLSFSMGGGTFYDDAVSHEAIPFKKPWLRSRVEGRIDQAIMITGRGDSMKPTIDDGDVLLIDTAQIVVRDPDLIWAFGYGDTGMVKRLRRQPRGGWLVQSDNPVVKDFKADDDEIRIVGRVIWIGRWQ